MQSVTAQILLQFLKMATEDRLACKLYVLTDYGTCVLLLYNPDQETDNKNNTKK